jgi:hypothetical protein
MFIRFVVPWSVVPGRCFEYGVSSDDDKHGMHNIRLVPFRQHLQSGRGMKKFPMSLKTSDIALNSELLNKFHSFGSKFGSMAWYNMRMYKVIRSWLKGFSSAAAFRGVESFLP